MNMNIPLELLIIIASNLNVATDLRNFRLVNQQCANAGTSLIACNGISIYNTSSDIIGFQELVERAEIANSIRELTFLFGSWPVCTQSQWETHPLLLGGKDRTNLTLRCKDTIADTTFVSYMDFIAAEQKRVYADDLQNIGNCLRRLRNLQTVVISNMKTSCRSYKYHRLQKKIWMSPSIKAGVGSIVKMFLQISCHLPSVTRLVICGNVRPSKAHCSSFMSVHPHIQEIHINGMNSTTPPGFL